MAELAENVPLYCTPLVAKALPHNRPWHPLPERGTLEVEGIIVTTGQAGHSLGGVWLHLALEGGVYYSGDACFESSVFPFDTPPKAAIALLDASYGCYDQPQAHCVQAISEHLYQPLAFPVPETGRALEMALWLAEAADRLQLTLAIDPVIRDNLAALLALPATLRRPGLDHSIRSLLARRNACPPTLMLMCDRSDTPEQWPDHHLLHTGYLTPDRRAELAAGQISWQRWNVHLRASHLVALTDQLDATQVVPLFTPFSDNALTAWQGLLGERLCTVQRLSAHSRLVTLPSLGSFACPQ